jgi:hypothetical protein
MHHIRKSRLLLLVLILGVAACRSVEDPDRGGRASDAEGRLGLVDAGQAVLSESDTAYLAAPGLGFVVDRQGSMYIVDDFQSKLMEFDHRGQLVRVFGAPGSGPGEFRTFERFTYVRDTVIIQATGNRVKGFNRYTGAYLGEFSHSRGFWSGYAEANDKLYLPLFNYGQKQGVFKVGWTRILDRLAGKVDLEVIANLIDFPPEYLETRSLSDFTNVSIAAWGDTLAAGYAGVPYIVIYRSDGTPVDTITVPWLDRRGFPDGWIDRFRLERQLTLAETVEAFSYLNGLWRMSDGRLLLWHQDNTANPDGTNPPMTGKAWISVLSTDRTSACVDAPIEFPGSGWPNLAFFNDTLYAIQQIISSDSLSAQTVVQKYTVNTEGCRWIPTNAER